LLVKEIMPAIVKDKLITFFQDRQDPVSGYFFDIHPDPVILSNPTIQARAYNFALQSLNWLGASPKYPLPNSTQPQAVSGVKMRSSSVYCDVLGEKYNICNEQDLLTWVSSLSWSTNPYSAGQKIADLSVYLKLIDTTKRDLYLQTLWNYFDQSQDPVTGFWGGGSLYNQLSGVMKMMGIYFPYNKMMPNMDKIYVNIIKALREETPSALMLTRNAIETMYKFISYSTGAQKTEMQKSVPEALRIAAKLTKTYVRPDGGIAYYPGNGLSVSQGVKIGYGITDESDVLGSNGALVLRTNAWRLSGFVYQSLSSKFSTGFYSLLLGTATVKDVTTNEIPIKIKTQPLRLEILSGLPSDVMIYDIKGILTLQKQVKENSMIDLRELKPGLYMARCTTNNKSYALKFIQQ